MRATTMTMVNEYQSAMCGQQVFPPNGGHITRHDPYTYGHATALALATHGTPNSHANSPCHGVAWPAGRFRR